jgi:hypothetical protein
MKFSIKYVIKEIFVNSNQKQYFVDVLILSIRILFIIHSMSYILHFTLLMSDFEHEIV